MHSVSCSFLFNLNNILMWSISSSTFIVSSDKTLLSNYMFPQSKWKHLIMLCFDHHHVWKPGRHFRKLKNKNQCMFCRRKWSANIQKLWFHTTLGLLHHFGNCSKQRVYKKCSLYILCTKLTPQSSLILITWPNFPSGYPYFYPQ